MLPVRMGLEQGMHSKDGLPVLVKNPIVEEVVAACEANDYLIVRGFSATRSFQPYVVLIGAQYESSSGKKYYLPRVRNILTKLSKKGSIFVGEWEGPEGLAKRKQDYRPDGFFYQYIGEEGFEVRFVDDEKVLDAEREMRRQGIDVGSREFKDRPKHLAAGVLKAVEDSEAVEFVEEGDQISVREPRRVFVAMDHNRFVSDMDILELLEKRGKTYVLICPKIVEPQKTADAVQNKYELRLDDISREKL